MPLETFDLTSRVALVTGAGAVDGIGFATARLLGSMGAAVAVSATTERVHERVADLGREGVRALGVVADLTSEVEVRDAVRRVAAELGPPAVLVNNAGMTSLSAPAVDVSAGGGAESGPVEGTTLEQWHRPTPWRPGGSGPAARPRTRSARPSARPSVAAPHRRRWRRPSRSSSVPARPT